MYRLKAMAALRANTMHRMTSNNILKLNPYSSRLAARKKPVRANGIAKMV
jgi:hypothetical protein